MALKKDYTPSQSVLDAGAAVEEQKRRKPGEYTSAYEESLRRVMDQILNREDFRYSLDGDALYRQYRNQAVQNGRLAMADAAGQASALTGGFGSSYSQSVGQQAYSRQMDALSDRIPELYNLAMNQYRLQTQGLQQRYDLLSAAQQEEYGRYQDALAAWQKEADRLLQTYLTERGRDYDAYRDEIEDQKWQAEFDESKRRYEQEWAAKHPTPVVVPGTVGSGGSKKTEQEKGKNPSILQPIFNLIDTILRPSGKK